MPILGILASSVPAAAGDYESIATVTVGSGGAASAEFTSIPATYNHLQVRYIARHATTDSSIRFQVNSDTGSNYVRHRLTGDGASVAAAAATSATFGGAGVALTNANIFSAQVMDILDYANTNKNKTFRTLRGDDANGSGSVEFLSSLWMSTNAITSIKFYFDSGNFAQYSHFALYGIKGA